MLTPRFITTRPQQSGHKSQAPLALPTVTARITLEGPSKVWSHSSKRTLAKFLQHIKQNTFFLWIGSLMHGIFQNRSNVLCFH